MNAIKKLFLSFKYAFEGLFFCIKTCRNFRIHLIAALVVLYFSRFYSFSATEYGILVIIISFILVAECINTAIEQLCNSITKDFSSQIKNAKDVAAAAVLCGAVSSVIIAVRFFYNPDVFRQIYVYYSSPLKLAFLIITAVISIIFIFCEDIFKNAKQ